MRTRPLLLLQATLLLGVAPPGLIAQRATPLPSDSTARARRFARWFFASHADSLWSHVAPEGKGPLASHAALLDMLQQVNSRTGTVGALMEERWGWHDGVRQYWHKRPVAAVPDPVVLRFAVDSVGRITRIAFQLERQAPVPDSGGVVLREQR